MLSQGDAAPGFTLPRDGGETITLSALRPAQVVLYFYPRDDTPGCTTEALDFTRLAREFEAAGAVVIGISKDSVKAHDRFCRKHGLGVILASDESGDTCERYGVWGEKSMYGKKYFGIIRSAFLIDEKGKISHAWPKISPKDTPTKLLKALEEG